MEEREEFIVQSVSYLQTLKTAEEYKAAKEEILSIMEKMFTFGLELLKDFLENMFSMTPEEREEKSQMFQDDSILLEPRIGAEMERLDSLPGADELQDEFEKEFEVRFAPVMEQYAEMGAKMMESLMGGFVDGLAEAFKPEEEAEEKEEEFVFDYDNPDTPRMLYDLYAARSLEELEENKDNLIAEMEEQMQDDIWNLELLTDEGYTPMEEDIKKIETILHRMKQYVREMEKEFTRISALPDAAERAGEIKKEIMDQLNPKHREIKRYLAKPWRR